MVFSVVCASLLLVVLIHHVLLFYYVFSLLVYIERVACFDSKQTELEWLVVLKIVNNNWFRIDGI